MIAAIAFSALAPAARAETYLSALDDVPVMPGFAEQTGQGVVFEAASGRIVAAVVVGAMRPGLDRGAVLGFYAATLPALGWRAESPSRFVRDGEALTLSIDQTRERLTLRFDLRPR